MKGAFSPTLIAALFGLFTVARAQTLEVKRSDAAYHSDDVLDPRTLLSPKNFNNIISGRYVIVEGFIDYVASAWPEKDGDFHFEMQTTNKLHTKNPKDGLVCEIDPLLQLEASEALKDIDQKKRSTYRKARVYGFLRFGTEANHAGVQKYTLPNGTVVSGHWEIHPVERVESIDSGSSLKLGPTAKYVRPPMDIRYGLDDTDFPKHTVSNYGVLRGTVKKISAGADGSGDVDVSLEVNSKTYIATIPQYCIANFDPSAQTVKLAQLPTFQSINYSLAPSETEQRSFYGLRNWRFNGSQMTPTMAPVETIK
ncbi:MAG: hypothetical protein QOI04_1562 [Verrucomicrobiota bacterium]|jgi:hypothetical protein